MAKKLRKNFYGAVNHKVDTKGRVSVPADFRAVDKNECVFLYPSQQHSDKPAVYVGFSRESLERFIDEIRKEPDFKAVNFRLDWIKSVLKRFEYDPEGRICMPKDYKDTLSLPEVMGGGTLAFVGCGNYFEIWNPEQWKKEFEARLKYASSIHRREPG